ncbi:SOS response-associated peptidase [Magnetospira sp. QH-2]|uniref:SOS response-associated peptidase n=1 Tax=Magnetospira sp. (strain QH-2) TaxID=1288970 RepID=UPI0003E80E30|nr:SOS response-associated peptidase family protein [Magnetospira sp. QH-2]CCQ74406.1 conserved protein of unknown function [Magnetospira sp. QH-2]
MCSRFNNGGSPQELQQRFGDWDWPDPLPNGDQRPTDSVLTLDIQEGARLLAWGIPSPFDGKPLINARSETLEIKQTFRPLLQRRVLVPASFYYEWRKDGKRSLKNRIGRPDGAYMALAGLTDGRFLTIVTCAPSPSIAHIHGRMPVILDESLERDWMNNQIGFGTIQPALAPAPDHLLSAVEDQPPPDPQMSLF